MKKLYTIKAFYDNVEYNGFFILKNNKLVLCDKGYYSYKDINKKLIVSENKDLLLDLIDEYEDTQRKKNKFYDEDKNLLKSLNSN